MSFGRLPAFKYVLQYCTFKVKPGNLELWFVYFGSTQLERVSNWPLPKMDRIQKQFVWWTIFLNFLIDFLMEVWVPEIY